MKLSKSIEVYLTFRRTSGLRYTQVERYLRSFHRRIGDLDLVDITAHHIATHLGVPVRQSATWQANYLRLRSFFNYWILRGEMGMVTMPPRPARHRATARPYVYSLPEIRRLLDATVVCQRRENCMVKAETFRTYLLLLYATGATSGELLDLRRGDLSLKKKTLTVFNRRFGDTRHIPIGDDLRRLLREYLERKPAIRSRNAPLLSDRKGNPILPWQVTYSFGRLRKIAGIVSPDQGAPPPRLLDFRTTFAVHRIQTWIQDGINLNRLLPALATYLGQASLGSIERYMDLTPERFRKHVALLSSKRPRRDGKTHFASPSNLYTPADEGWVPGPMKPLAR